MPQKKSDRRIKDPQLRDDYTNEEFLGVVNSGKQDLTHCPVAEHPDLSPSLLVRPGKEPGTAHAKCLVGCPHNAVKRALIDRLGIAEELIADNWRYEEKPPLEPWPSVLETPTQYLGFPVVARYKYLDLEGEHVGWMLRYELPPSEKNPEGGKAFVPCRLVNGSVEFVGFPPGSVFYNWPSVVGRTTKRFHEGEKAVDAAQQLWPEDANLTGPNGAGSVNSWPYDHMFDKWVKPGDRLVLHMDAGPAGDEMGAKLVRNIRLYWDGELFAIDTTGLPNGYDAADILAEGKDPVLWEQERSREIPFGQGYNGKYDNNQVQDRVRQLISKSPSDVESGLQEIKNLISPVVRLGIGVLRQEFRNVRRQEQDISDFGRAIAELVLEKDFAAGEHLMHLTDGNFWHFNGRHWIAMQEQTVKTIVQNRVESENIDLGDAKLKTMVADATELLRNVVHRADDVLGFLLPPPNVLCLLNGELDLSSDVRELRPHDPKSYLRIPIDVEYDPDATSPVWDKFVQQVMRPETDRCAIKDEDDRYKVIWDDEKKQYRERTEDEVAAIAKDRARHLEELMSEAISPRKIVQGCFVLSVGEGSNGKTQVVKLIENMSGLGCYAGTLESVFANNFSSSALVGVSNLIDDDYDLRQQIPEAKLKKVSERKRMDGEIKNGKKYQFIAEVTPWLNAQDFPAAGDNSYGFLRRANVVSFQQHYTLPRDLEKEAKQLGYKDGKASIKAGAIVLTDDKMEAKLKAERSGILNRLLDARERLARRGGFREPKLNTDDRELWTVAGNTVIAYAKAELVEQPGEHTLLTSFKDDYRMWCIGNSYKAKGERKIRKDLERAGYTITDTDGRPYLRNHKTRKKVEIEKHKD